MAIKILPYNMASEGAKILADRLKCVRIRREQSKYVYKNKDIIINWGCSKRPPHIPVDAIVINPFTAVANAVDKLKAFLVMENYGKINIAPFTADIDIARDWIEEGYKVVCRTIANGTRGEGIIIAEEPEEIVLAPLYTRYIKKKKEYRVHVAFNDVIGVSRKVLRPDYDKKFVNWHIRNFDNGFIFQEYDKNGLPEWENCPDCVLHTALKAVEALGLHFGGVDVIYNESWDTAFVLEVNSSPGLMDATGEHYLKAIQNAVNRLEVNPQLDKEVKPAPRVDKEKVKGVMEAAGFEWGPEDNVDEDWLGAV